MKLALVVLGLSGCDLLFDIHRLQIASSDDAGQGSDAGSGRTADAADCGSHDEDSDNIFDKCDRCPTISDSGDTDMDSDGVDDLCDPNQSGTNSIDAFYSFQNDVGFTAGATFPNDTMRLNTSVVSTKSFMAEPKQIVLSIDGLNAVTADVQIALNPGGTDDVLCELATTCASPATTCVFSYLHGVQVGTMGSTLAPAQVTSLMLYRTSTGEVRCSVNDKGAGHTVTITGATMPVGKLQLSAPNVPVTLPNLIVYGGA